MQTDISGRMRSLWNRKTIRNETRVWTLVQTKYSAQVPDSAALAGNLSAWGVVKPLLASTPACHNAFILPAALDRAAGVVVRVHPGLTIDIVNIILCVTPNMVSSIVVTSSREVAVFDKQDTSVRLHEPCVILTLVQIFLEASVLFWLKLSSIFAA